MPKAKGDDINPSCDISEIIAQLKNLKASRIRNVVDARLKEFRAVGEKNNNELFKELCFCILTANFSAERAIKIQNEIDAGFITLTEAELAKKLRTLGHRFPNTRAKYIIQARAYKTMLKNVIKNDNNPREWLVKHIKGIGYKEASHFLRNIGFEDVAIIDFHILDALSSYGLIKKSKARTLTRRRYLEIESLLKSLASNVGMNLAELDLYLWYIETGKVLK